MASDPEILLRTVGMAGFEPAASCSQISPEPPPGDSGDRWDVDHLR